MHAVIETPEFQRKAKEAGVSIAERDEMIKFISSNPEAGDLIPGSGGARKIRFRRAGSGKSGGYRVITYFAGTDIPVFLLTMFAKGDRADLSQAQRNELRSILPLIVEEYRKGVISHVQGRR